MRKPHICCYLIFIVYPLFCHTAYAQSKSKYLNKFQIDLAGKWLFQIDSLDKGVTEKWFDRHLSDHVILPGSMTTNGKGDDITLHTPWTGSIFDSSYYHKPEYAKYRQPGNIKVPFWLQPVKYYKGPAWYQKIVDIPASWNDKHIELFIERSHWETTVWVDGTNIGMQNSLATAHVFDLTKALTAGKHTLSIRVDNRIKDIDFGQNSHSVTDHTQTNWNGMIGHLYIKARPMVYVDDVQLYPDIKHKKVIVKIKVANSIGRDVPIAVAIRAIGNKRASILKVLNRNFIAKAAGSIIEMEYPMGNDPLEWSEFTPDFYKMHLTLKYRNESDKKDEIFGMRDFSTRGTQFTINGQPTFLRGMLECAVFPKTGYPPTDVASWVKEFKVCRSYGLNHLRFHSWCPPEAAFVAADSLGFYLQIECSSWANQGATIGDGKPLDQYIYDESNRIVKAYGNHPSFCMMVYGNEPAGEGLEKYLTGFVKYWKAKDPRRLYSTAAGWPIIPESNYNSTPEPRIQHWEEGLKSIINSKAPSTSYDWRDIIAKWQHPTVSHEIGQWCVYPDFDEIKEYKGILKANNLEIFRDKLNSNGLGSYAHDFLYSSGKLQALCYKADIEAALRTPGFGGFQLLGLYDFPGQGTALVGVVNAFGGDKGYITGPEYRSFCNSIVPLVRLPKMVFLNNEELNIPAEVAQFGSQIIRNVIPHWEIRSGDGKVLFNGSLPRTNIPYGNGISIGTIKQSLSTINNPSRLTLVLNVGSYKNSWDIFVYPHKLPETDPHILVTQALDQKAIDLLNNGGKVLLTLKKGTLRQEMGGDIAIGFSSIFWNTAWTHQQPPTTMGIFCDPQNAALHDFPTQSFSNWQWWDAMTHSNVIKLDSVSKNLHPIVRIIDDWVTARSLGLIFECKVGKGQLLVSGIDLLSDIDSRVEARQLLYSLKNYMQTEKFNPKATVELKKLQLFPLKRTPTGRLMVLIPEPKICFKP
jgi:hypothetical protein